MPLDARTTSTPHRFTREEYHRMGKAGLFLEERVELIEGEIITMSPKNSLHAATVHHLWSLLSRLFSATAHVRAQDPIILDDWSEPEPAIAVCQPNPYNFAREHPRALQVLLVIEVADTSVAYDRRKARAYAASSIPACWLLNLRTRWISAPTDPDPAARPYRLERVATERDVLSLPGEQSLAVSDLLLPVLST